MADGKTDDLINRDLKQPEGIPLALPSADAADERTLRLVLYDALASDAMGTLTTGVFLVGFALALGAGNFAIGVLAAVPFAVQWLQIPAVLLVERWRVRRDICVISAALGRTFLLAAAATPLIGGGVAVVALVVALAIYQAMAAIAGCAWNSWMRDLVPSTQYGRFFGRPSCHRTGETSRRSTSHRSLNDRNHQPAQGYRNKRCAILASRLSVHDLIKDGVAARALRLRRLAQRAADLLVKR